MKTVLLMALLVSTSAFARGGGSSTGPSACSYAEYACASRDGFTVVCPDAKGTLVSLELKNGGSFSSIYPTSFSQTQDGKTEFSGNDLILTIDTSAALDEETLPAQIIFSPAGYFNYDLRCKKN